MKESRKPLKQRTSYKIWKAIDNHPYLFFIIVAVLIMGILYLTFSISQQEAYEIALESYDKEQYENLDEAIAKNMQNGFPNISEVPEDIEFGIEKQSDSEEIKYTFYPKVNDNKSWLMPNLMITVTISKSGELLSKTSYYETEESYIKEVHGNYKFCRFFMAIFGTAPILCLVLLIMMLIAYYWEKEEVKEWTKEYEELWKRLTEFALGKTDECDDEEDIKQVEDEPKDNDE